MAIKLLGKPVAQGILDEVARRVDERRAVGRSFKLCAIRVGDRADDMAYERSLSKACSKCGITLDSIVLDESSSTSDVIRAIRHVNDDSTADGCMVFQPMPKHIDSQAACNVICRSKDVDCASDANLGEVLLGSKCAFAPATAEAVIRVCDHYGIDLEGARLVVVGRSRVIGKPAGLLALERHATVTFCHSRTRNLEDVTSNAEIVVCAVGRAGFFDARYFSPGQTVIDVGMNIDSAGNLCGDVDFDAVENMVSAITPVPGGIGAITTSILLEHVTREDGE